LKGETEKWISEREIIERTISRAHIFFDGKELKTFVTINISFVSKRTGYSPLDRTFKVIGSTKDMADEQATRGACPARFVPVVVIRITKVRGLKDRNHPEQESQISLTVNRVQLHNHYELRGQQGGDRDNG
jgi:hypothetical protein